MTLIRVVRLYDISPDSKYCGKCSCLVNYTSTGNYPIEAHRCEAFDTNLEFESIHKGHPGGYHHKPLRCRKCMRKLPSNLPKQRSKL